MSIERSVDAGPQKIPTLERTRVARSIDAVPLRRLAREVSAVLQCSRSRLLRDPKARAAILHRRGRPRPPLEKKRSRNWRYDPRKISHDVRFTDDFAHESPWKAIAIAALGGILVGMLAAR